MSDQTNIRRVSFVVSDFYQNNRIFDEDDSSVNRDDSMRVFIDLKRELDHHGVNIGTQDVVTIQESDLVLFDNAPTLDSPDFVAARDQNRVLFVLISEIGFLHPPNFDAEVHKQFDKVFTYQDELIDNDRFLKFNYSFRLPKSIPKELSKKNKLCTLIAANKTLNHPLELYSHRCDAIRWFEKHHPDEFDLYGFGWDLPPMFHGPRLLRIFNRSNALRRMVSHPFNCYRGTVESKQSVIERYKFAICYENIRDVPGWITEKIFDCFFGGCVPVYLGANNITNHIPADCFIDKRNFATYEELYDYMIGMSDEEYENFLDAIENYLLSPQAYPFSTEYVVTTIAGAIREALTRSGS